MSEQADSRIRIKSEFGGIVDVPVDNTHELLSQVIKEGCGRKFEEEDEEELILNLRSDGEGQGDQSIIESSPFGVHNGGEELEEDHHHLLHSEVQVQVRDQSQQTQNGNLQDSDVHSRIGHEEEVQLEISSNECQKKLLEDVKVEEMENQAPLPALDPNQVEANLRHHGMNSEGSEILNIPPVTLLGVSSLAPFVLSDNEVPDAAETISVSIEQQGENVQGQQMNHHQHQQSNQQSKQSLQLLQSSQIQASCWEDAVSAPVLPIRCKDTNAELHKNRFGSGNKGKCIRLGNDWFTPTEFEALCGRGNSKDWKRSIRFGGRTLQTLIDKGFLTPHASSCICSNCVDDAAATGPMRPFTPYQRKRKGQSESGGKGTKLERHTSKDSNNEESLDLGSSSAPLGGIAAALNPLTQALLKINTTSLSPCNQEAWKTIEDNVGKLVSASLLLKSMVQEMKDRTNQELESLRTQIQESATQYQNLQNQQQQQQQQQSQQHLQQQSQSQSNDVHHNHHHLSPHNSQRITVTQNLEPQILRIFDSSRIQTYSIEVLDPETFKQLQQNPSPSDSQQQQHCLTFKVPHQA